MSWGSLGLVDVGVTSGELVELGWIEGLEGAVDSGEVKAEIDSRLGSWQDKNNEQLTKIENL